MYLFLSILFIWLCLAICKGKRLPGDFSVEATLPLRGLLAVGIVFHHISQRVALVVPDVWGVSQFEFWGPPIVAVFFFLSGYGLMKNLQVKGASYLDGFLRKRMTKVFLPLLLCSLVYSVADLGISGGQFADMRVDWPFLPNAWFCVTIAVCYFAFYVITLCTKQRMTRLLVWMWVFTLGYVVCLKALGFRNWWFQSVVSLNMGLSVALFEGRIRKLLAGHFRLLACTLFLVVGILAFGTSRWDVAGFPCGTVLLSAFVGTLIYILSCGYSLPMCGLSRFLGRHSYEIYLVQGAVVSVVFGRAYTYIPDWWLAMMAFTLFSTFALALILKKVISIILR